jgi:hypothetical protein
MPRYGEISLKNPSNGLRESFKMMHPPRKMMRKMNQTMRIAKARTYK